MGVRGHFCMFGSYKSIFYCWTAAFYVTKLPRYVKKLSIFEEWLLDDFPIDIYRRNLVTICVNIFLFFELRCSRSCWNGRVLLVLTKLGNFIGNNTKIWEMLTKAIKFWLFFTKTWFSQNHASTDFFFKNKARKLKFVLVVPLYSI